MRLVQPAVSVSSTARASRCSAVARFTTFVCGVPALSSVPWNQVRAWPRWRTDSMWRSFWRSSQTSSVGRLARARRPRIRWPVPKASMVTPLRMTIRPACQMGPRPAARGYWRAISSLSTSSALRFSRWAWA